MLTLVLGTHAMASMPGYKYIHMIYSPHTDRKATQLLIPHSCTDSACEWILSRFMPLYKCSYFIQETHFWL